uniref:Histidine-containing phosphotransfer protein n=1 Tax=Aegilops tauschii TaxID=37682 RepID=R7WAD3_AEGTA
MAAAALRARLNTHISRMYAEGVVEEETFEQLREDGIATEVARLFINEAYEILHDIDIRMSALTPSISPSTLGLATDSPCLLLNSQGGAGSGHRRGGSPDAAAHGVRLQGVHLMGHDRTSVGAQQVNLACMHFGDFYAIKCKQGCLVSLDLVRNLYCIVRNDMEIMMQLEDQIAACGPK